jgi:hypothetical protein
LSSKAIPGIVRSRRAFGLETQLLRGAKDGTRQGPAVVEDDLRNLLGGLAEDLNRRIDGKGDILWGTKFADIKELAIQIGRRSPGR